MSTHGETAFLREFKAQFEKVPGCPLHLLRAPWVANCQLMYIPCGQWTDLS